MIYTTTEKVIVEDMDKNLKMNNRSFLRILQEAANRASTSVGYGLSNMNETQTSWVILNWRVEIIDRANYGEELIIKTWANFSKKIYSSRYFEIYRGNELIARADSKWVFVNAITHSIEKISDEIIEKYEPEDNQVFEDEFKEKIKFPENLEKVYSYTIMKRDLDANHHVNNIVFLDIASEIIPNEIILNAKNICVVYKKEIEYGDTISCYYSDNIVYLYNDENKILHGAVILK